MDAPAAKRLRGGGVEESSDDQQALAFLDLQDDFSCVVCMELMLGAIFQCTEGHIICEGCAGRLPEPKECPTCRERYPGAKPIRNRALEAVVAKADLPCVAGCGFRAIGGALGAHLRSCPRRVVECPVTDCPGRRLLCDLAGHVEEAHPGAFRRLCPPKVCCTLGHFTLLDLDTYNGMCTFTVQVGVGDVVLAKANYFRALDLRSPSEECSVVQCRAFHMSKPKQVAFSVWCEKRLLAMGAEAATEPVPAGSALREQLELGDPKGQHWFLRVQLENNIRPGDVMELRMKVTEV